MPMRCAASTFSLMPPTGSTRPESVISPVMATRGRTGRPGEQRDEGGHQGDAGGRTVLGDGALGDVQVQVDALEERLLDAELPRVGAHPATARPARSPS